MSDTATTHHNTHDQPHARPGHRRPLRIGSLCTGFGGLDQAVVDVVGGGVAWVADNDPDVRRLLTHRHADVPNLGDIRAVDWDHIAATAPVDVVVAGFPCQSISLIGPGGGIAHGTRSGLWFAVMDAVRRLAPDLLVLENVSALRRRGLDIVLGDLARARYDTQWTSVRADEIGAPHRRERVFLAAWPTRPSHASGPRRQGSGQRGRTAGRHPHPHHHGAASHSGHGQAPRSRIARCVHGTTPPTPTVAAHTDGQRRCQGQPPATRRPGLRVDPLAPRRAPRATHPAAADHDWGRYEAAVRHWEHTLGRPAPAPTRLGPRGTPQLTPEFVEWCMGVDDGWVTDVPDLTRVAQIRILGNGVVHQQARLALHRLAQDIDRSGSHNLLTRTAAEHTEEPTNSPSR